MAKITVEIDLDEYISQAAYDMGEYGESPAPLDKFILQKLSGNIIDSLSGDCRKRVKEVVDERFNSALDKAIDERVSERMSIFLQNEVSVTDHWGKPTFVGSVEDLMAKAFDERLLHPVDGQGHKVKGCSSSGTTYIEWLLKSKIEDNIKRIENDFANKVVSDVKKTVDANIQKVKEEAAAKAIAALNVSIRA